MKALALFSGGLDSILAVKLIQEQGVEVIGVSFETPFFSSQKAIRSARYIGLPLKVVDITDSILQIVLSPRHGYGKGLIRGGANGVGGEVLTAVVLIPGNLVVIPRCGEYIQVAIAV